MMVFIRGSRVCDGDPEEQIENTKTCSRDEYLDRMHQIVYDAEEIIPSMNARDGGNNWGAPARGLESEECLSRMISNDVIDDLYQKAIAAGAYGGKLAGPEAAVFCFSWLLWRNSRISECPAGSAGG